MMGRGNLSQHFSRLVALVGLCLVSLAGQASDERIWLEGKVNGKPLRFIFDTGAGDIILFRSTAEKLGLKVTNPPQNVQGVPGTVAMGRSEKCDFSLGENTTGLTLAIFEPPAPLQVNADGIIGWNPIKNNIIQIDAEKATVKCLAEIPPEMAGWTRFSIKLAPESGVLILTAAGQPGEPSFIIDTGSDFGLKLCPKKWREWLAAHPDQPKTLGAYYTPAEGLVVVVETLGKERPLGPLMLTAVPVTEACAAEAALGGENYEGTLGLAVLARLDFIIDGPKGIAYLRPRQTPAQPYQHNRLGAVFSPVDLAHEDLVARVIEGSPAFEAGIRTGDLLLKIDDLDVTRWRTDPKVLPLSRFWERPPGTRMVVTVKQGQKTVAITVTLRQILSIDGKP
jgi:hypothetical protein